MNASAGNIFLRCVLGYCTFAVSCKSVGYCFEEIFPFISRLRSALWSLIFVYFVVSHFNNYGKCQTVVKWSSGSF